jgi:hypothetical protein
MIIMIDNSCGSANKMSLVQKCWDAWMPRKRGAWSGELKRWDAGTLGRQDANNNGKSSWLIAPS